MSMITKQQLEAGPVRVAGSGTTALGVVGTVLGGVAVASLANNNLLGNWFGNNNCHGHRGYNDNCDYGHGYGHGNKDGYSTVARLEDELYYCKSKDYTNGITHLLEEKIEKMFEPVYGQLKFLEINAAVTKAVECQKEKDNAIIEKMKYYIDQLEDAQYVKLQTSPPCGAKLVPCGQDK